MFLSTAFLDHQRIATLLRKIFEKECKFVEDKLKSRQTVNKLIQFLLSTSRREYSCTLARIPQILNIVGRRIVTKTIKSGKKTILSHVSSCSPGNWSKPRIPNCRKLTPPRQSAGREISINPGKLRRFIRRNTCFRDATWPWRLRQRRRRIVLT